jgi:DNA-binding response OmpR family regulator
MRSEMSIVSNDVAKEAAMDFPATSRSDPLPWRPRILLIEDDPGVRDLIELLLLDEGFHMSCWHDVHGVRSVARNRPDLIVLDLLIAGSDAGWELLQELSNDRMTWQNPVVVCTAHIPLVKREEQRLRDLEVGVVLKPFDVDELFADVASCG